MTRPTHYLSWRIWTVYAVLAGISIPWYWPAEDTRTLLGFPLWAVVSILGSLAVSCFTAWLFAGMLAGLVFALLFFWVPAKGEGFLTPLKSSGFHPGIYGLLLNIVIGVSGSWIVNARSKDIWQIAKLISGQAGLRCPVSH